MPSHGVSAVTGSIAGRTSVITTVPDASLAACIAAVDNPKPTATPASEHIATSVATRPRSLLGKIVSRLSGGTFSTDIEYLASGPGLSSSIWTSGPSTASSD